MKILITEGNGEIVEKKSRFIAYLKNVSTEEEANAFIESIKKKHYDARHNCSAMIIGEKGEITRSSDDGEPSGTAGRPILECLSHAGLINVCCVVTRYFGGTLLGTGGLIRAYTDAVNDALANSTIGEVIKGMEFTVRIAYPLTGEVEYFIRNNDVYLDSSVYEADVSYRLRMSAEIAEDIKNKLIALTESRIEILDEKECRYTKKQGE